MDRDLRKITGRLLCQMDQFFNSVPSAELQPYTLQSWECEGVI